MKVVFSDRLVMERGARARFASAAWFDEVRRRAEKLAERSDGEVAETLRQCAALLAIGAAQVEADARFEAQIRKLRRELGRATRSENARTESAKRKRQWLKLRREVRRDHAFRNRPEREWNAEADRRLVEWLAARGIGVSAKTIANQRSREGWLDD